MSSAAINSRTRASVALVEVLYSAASYSPLPSLRASIPSPGSACPAAGKRPKSSVRPPGGREAEQQRWGFGFQGLKPLATFVRPTGEERKRREEEGGVLIQGLKPLPTFVCPTGEEGQARNLRFRGRPAGENRAARLLRCLDGPACGRLLSMFARPAPVPGRVAAKVDGGMSPGRPVAPA